MEVCRNYINTIQLKVDANNYLKNYNYHNPNQSEIFMMKKN